SRLNLLQAFNSLGTTLAPRFGSWLILGVALAPASIEVVRAMGADQLHAYRIQQAASVKVPYIGLSLALILLAATVGWFKLPVIEYAEAHGHATGSIWRHRRLVLGGVAVVVYVGAGVGMCRLVANFLYLVESGGV